MNSVLIVSRSGVCSIPARNPDVLFEVTLETLRDAANEIEYLRPTAFCDTGAAVRFNERQHTRRDLVREMEAI